MHKLKKMQQGGDIQTQLYAPITQSQLDKGASVTAQNKALLQPPVYSAPNAISSLQSVLNTNLTSQLNQPGAFGRGAGIPGGKQPTNYLNAGLGLGSSLLSGLNPGKTERNNLDSTRNAAFKTGNQIASAFGPIGMAASAVNNIVDMTGGFTDTSKGLGGGNDALNFVSSLALPGAGWFTKRLDNYKVSGRLGQSSGYTGTSANNQKVSDNIAGRKILFGRNTAKSKIADAQNKDRQVNSILNQADDAFAGASNTQLLSLANQVNRQGNDWIYNTRVGKSGMSISKIKNVVSKAQKFAEGGKMNVIPDGALHAHKNHLEDINPDLEGITAKGIPVVTQEEGGLVQHAEVEREEIILIKEVTAKLEKLREEGTDEAAIEAGKLLAQQIMENTKDNTNKILHNED